MCRLLGFAAPSARSFADAVGAVQTATFCAMARLHDDGWGAAWADGGTSGGLGTRRSPRSGFEDPELEALSTGTTARAGLLHLRLASSGMPVQPENTHPFVGRLDGVDVALAHNGAIKPASRLEELLPGAVRAALRGATDSERYAALVRTRAAELGDLAAGAASAAATLSPLFPASSLNAVLLSPRELVVVHVSDGARIPHEDFDASGIAEDELPTGHRTGYYQLWRRRSDDGAVAFSSSGLRVDGWEPLAPRTVVRVDLATMEETVIPVVPVVPVTPVLPGGAHDVDAAAGTVRIPSPAARSESHEGARGARVGG